MMSTKLGHLSKRHYNRKRNKSFPLSLSGMIGITDLDEIANKFNICIS